MLFKPWLTRTELEDRRRLDDQTKFWVMALRVPLRAMFHVESMVESAMGHVINSLPPEQDRSRPKLMNLKFELVKEAEANFEPELSIRLGNEVLSIKFVCKHTPWCDRCKWWYHTADPREGEQEAEQGGQRMGRRGGGSDRAERPEDNPYIRVAARDQVGARGGTGQIRPTTSVDRPGPRAVQEPVATRGDSQVRSARSELRIGGQVPGRPRGIGELQTPADGARPPPTARGSQSQLLHPAQQPIFNPGFRPFVPGWGPVQWQGQYHQPYGCNGLGLDPYFQFPYDAGHVLDYGGTYMEGNFRRGVQAQGEMRGGGSGTPEPASGGQLPAPQEQQATQVDEDAEELEDENGDVERLPRFRIFPEFHMPKIRVVLEDDRMIRYTVVFIDARFSSDEWTCLSRVGLGSFPLNGLVQASEKILFEVVVSPGVAAIFLANLHPSTPRTCNLTSSPFLRCVSFDWAAMDEVASPEGARDVNPSAAGIQSAAVPLPSHG
ncbi:hypothetical protein CBR_g36313 [Chara braunii]|uniref:Uncharacterized protein n=1 Tax=Chara braunii TaxID=69332 RepID=A0A388LKN0_CHABU|nr:hypothetical protein CBR_g36313 [Chara braunii]|eukprot:GBG82782.1 hypothetical protein CBR_g36313 [Chara braunii]